MPKRKAPEKIGDVLREIRLAHGWTVGEVARAAWMDPTYLSKLETSALPSTPRRETVERLANAMECSAEERQRLYRASGREKLSPHTVALIAETIADMLYTRADGSRVQLLIMADKDGVEHGGWSKGPVRHRITKILEDL